MSARGFTLLELVQVMVLLAIAVTGLTSYLSYSAFFYQESVLQQRLVDQGRFALERISRELRSALPNSVRWSQQGALECLEFVPIARSGIYRHLPLYPSQANQLDVVTVGDDWSASAGQRVVVYPTVAQHVYVVSQGRAITLPAQTLTDADGNVNTRRLTLPNATSFSADSPQQRFYLVDSPVSFCRQGTQILRYSGYGYQEAQPLPPLAVGVPLLSSLQNTSAELAFSYSAGSLSRHAAVQLRFILGEGPTDTSLQLHHEVNIPNVP